VRESEAESFPSDASFSRLEELVWCPEGPFVRSSTFCSRLFRSSSRFGARVWRATLAIRSAIPPARSELVWRVTGTTAARFPRREFPRDLHHPVRPASDENAEGEGEGERQDHHGKAASRAVLPCRAAGLGVHFAKGDRDRPIGDPETFCWAGGRVHPDDAQAGSL